MNTIVSRFDNPGSFLHGRSRCDHCGKTLRFYELIPVVSYVVQGGRCRHCHKPIRGRYPIVELMTGGIFLLLYQGQGDHLAQFVMAAAFFTTLIIASLIDIDTLTIPDSLLIISVIFSLFNRFVILHSNPSAVFQGIALGLAIPAVFVIPTKGRVMGFGDLKLGGVLGLWLGLPGAAVAYWAAFCLGGLISLGLVATRRKRFRDEIAFGPYLVMGALIAELYASKLIAYVTFS